MTRVIKASALTKDHVGLIASHEGAPDPRVIVDLPSTSLTFVMIVWARGGWTSVGMDTDITIHDEPEEGP